MRLAVSIALMLVVAAAAQAGQQRYKPMPSMSEEAYERLTDRLIAHPPLLTPGRLPDGYKLGRCFLAVKGRTLISGNCAYHISDGGAFEMHGPRQVYAGIDYPRPQALAQEISTDYFVQVDREDVGKGAAADRWDAWWNEEKGATHSQSPLGTMVRNGACYSNSDAKVCLWKQ